MNGREMTDEERLAKLADIEMSPDNTRGILRALLKRVEALENARGK